MQPLPEFEYLEPTSIGEAAQILAENGASSMIIGGGTDMVPSIRQGIFGPRVVVSLGAISGLRTIEWEDGTGLKIGASATLRSLQNNEEILNRFPVIAQAAAEVGSPQLREMATVGGNLCLDTRCYFYNQSIDWKECSQFCLKVGGEICKATPSGRAKRCFAVFSADLAPALVALDARVTLVSAGGERTVALRDYYTGDGAKPHTKGPEEILTSVLVPKEKAGVFGTYQKYRIRQSIDYPIASVALTLRLADMGKTVSEVCLVVNGIASQPVVVKGIPDLLDDCELNDERIESAAKLARKAALTFANTAGDKDHRKQMIYEFTKKAFALAAKHGSET